MALQAANLDRLFVIAMHHAGAFAEHGNRADAGAARPENIGVEDGHRGAAQISRGDLLDKAGNVNVGRAGGGAGRVEAVQAAVRLNHRSLRGKGRMQVRKALGDLGIGMECSVHPQVS